MSIIFTTGWEEEYIILSEGIWNISRYDATAVGDCDMRWHGMDYFFAYFPVFKTFKWTVNVKSYIYSNLG
jgi:hypothetical protein